MKICIISQGGKSSNLIADACKKVFSQVDSLKIQDIEVHLNENKIHVSHSKKDLEKYDCIYVRGSFRYALLQRSITRALYDEAYMPVSSETFTIAHDKFLSLIELQRRGVPVPKTYYATPNRAKGILEKEVKFPVIIKVPEGTHGKGVMVADSLKSAKTVLDVLDDVRKPYLIQDFVETKKSSDIRAIVVGDEVIAAYKRVAEKGEIRSNTHLGGSRERHKITKKEEIIAINSAKAIGADICGVDILNSKEPSVIEVNLCPSLTAVKEMTDVNAAEKIAEFLLEKSKEFAKAKEPSDVQPKPEQVSMNLDSFLPK